MSQDPDPLATLRRRAGGKAPINVGPGWWPLLVELDALISAFAPDYLLWDARSSQGRLQYMTGWADSGTYACCAQWLAGDPMPDISDPQMPSWGERYGRHLDGHEHQAGVQAAEVEAHRQQEADTRMLPFLAAAADLSSRICEISGLPGVLMTRDGNFRTLNPFIPEAAGWVLPPAALGSEDIDSRLIECGGDQGRMFAHLETLHERRMEYAQHLRRVMDSANVLLDQGSPKRTDP